MRENTTFVPQEGGSISFQRKAPWTLGKVVNEILKKKGTGLTRALRVFVNGTRMDREKDGGRKLRSRDTLLIIDDGEHSMRGSSWWVGGYSHLLP